MGRLMAAAGLLALVVMTGVAQAEEKANPTGTWKWTIQMGDQSREMTLKLKLDGDKLTGSMPGRDGAETAISDGKFKDGELSFSVTRERQGQKFTTKYAGKLSGNTIKGKMTFERGGESQSREWEAKRAEEKKAA
jgi:hypothetical protein